jgi:hypothetical protein
MSFPSISYPASSFSLPSASTLEKACYTLIFSGLIILLFTLGYFSVGAVSGALSGYSASFLGVVFLMIYHYRLLGDTSGVAKILGFLTPYLVLLCLFSFSIYLLSAYFVVISVGHVSSSYVLFQYLSLILQGGLVGLFSMGGGSSMLSLVIGLLDLFLLLTIYISLKYYTTDGFSVIPLWLQGKRMRYARPTWTHPTYASPFPPGTMNM